MQISIESMAYGADAVGHVDGKAVFVAGGVPGDVVEAEVLSDGKSFTRARVSRVLEASPDRVAPRCPYADLCGGCPWSNMAYEAQLRAKHKNVCDALERIGKFSSEEVARLVAPIEAPGEPWGYRNKVELAVTMGPRGLSLGMHGRFDASAVVPVDRCLLLPRAKQKLPKAVSGALKYLGMGPRGLSLGMHGRFDASAVVPVDRCLLLPRAKQKLPKAVSGALKYLGGSRELGLERVGIRVSERTEQVEVALWTDPAAFPRSEVAKVLSDAAHPTSTVRVLVKEKGGARKIAGIERLEGFGSWEERIAGGTMRVSAPSFFQVNTAGADRLVELVLEGLSLEGDEVAADLYCGAGTFTLPLARALDDVIAIESYGPAVRDLNRNLADQHLDDVVEAVGDDAERQLDAVEDVDVVVVDPPRAGLDRSVVEALSNSPAHTVAYVSCDPATLARDLAAFAEIGKLKPERITPVDLFPQTYHVENVTILRRS